MTARRRPLRELEVLDEIVSFHGAVVLCWRCKKPLTTEDIRSKNVQNEHLVEHGLEGADEPFNRRFSHTDCHKVVTFGNGATTAGSSIGRIAKTKRIARTKKFEVKKPPLGGDPPDQAEDNTPGAVTRQSRSRWRQGRKIKSAGFQKVHRPMRQRRQAHVQEETR